MSEVPTGWKIQPLSEIAQIVRGVTYKKSDARSEPSAGYAPLLRATNIGSALDLTGDLVYVPCSVVSPDQFLRVGDIVLASSSGSLSVVGKNAPVKAEWFGTFGAFCAVIRPRNNVDSRYLSHYLSSEVVRRGWSEAARGTSINNLKKSDLSPTPVPLPSLAEQRRISDLLEDHLSRLDAAEAGLTRSLRRLATLQERTISAHLLGESLPGERLAATLAYCGTDDGLLPDLPRGWNWQRLSQVAEVVGGVTKDAKKQSDPSYVEVPYLRVANVQRGRLDLKTVAKIRVSAQKAEALRLRLGDVLMNEGGDRDKLARGWVWEGQIADCIHQNHVFRARVLEGTLEPRLLAWAANTFGARWAERNGKQSVNLASISLGKIRQMPVPVPPRNLQADLVKTLEDRLAAQQHLSAQLRITLARTAALRQALLSAAFTGRLGRSEHPDVVPLEELTVV